jgi:hypothetical protein
MGVEVPIYESDSSVIMAMRMTPTVIPCLSVCMYVCICMYVCMCVCVCVTVCTCAAGSRRAGIESSGGAECPLRCAVACGSSASATRST